MIAYAELQVASNFSFLRGASHPAELVATAASLGLAAIGLADRNSFAGVVRAHHAARQLGLRFLVGVRLDLLRELPEPRALAPEAGEGTGWIGERTRRPPPEPDLSLLAYPTDRAAYGRLTRLLTLGKRRAPKGHCHLTLDDVIAHGEGQIVIALPPEKDSPQRHRDTEKGCPHGGAPTYRSDVGAAPCGRPPSHHLCVSVPLWFEEILCRLADAFPGRAYLAAQHLCRGDDERRLEALAALARRCGTPLVATNDVHMHEASRRPLQDVLTCIREHCTIDEAGFRLFPNAERHLKPPAAMAALFADHPDAIARTMEIAERCRFSLDELRYEYPIESGGEGRTPQQELTLRTWEAARERFPGGVPGKVRETLEHELALIEQLGYASYFLTVHEIVRFARGAGILCQGRGSAANSAVCYCLGITAVDPVRHDLLFERFVSAARNEPPDIDVDFEHERREEVIQHIYRTYGRDRAGLAATVICYRGRSAIREVGKALGLSLDTVGALAGSLWGWSTEGVPEAQVRELGLDPSAGRLALALALARQLIGFPRHLSQHVGGFVITRGPLEELVPIENAAMEDRTVIEWDKDDLDDLGMLKVDVLGLGMLTCLAKGFALIKQHYGKTYGLAGVPAEDPAVYDMLCEADSIGVFQVESRAQMSMLPRLRPRKFYDLVIEVAIVRPGPIQGDMVHPYLRRRNGEEEVSYPSKDLEAVLGKTLGVPLFQEQAMRIAIVAGGFTAGEADQLRRAMATFRKVGTIHTFGNKLIEGMVARGYERDFAERCFKQIEGFGEYGFPESHAASFALLVYVSAWMKCHYPEVFACALLNRQPMGFYAPAQIVRDARDHGVEALPVDVNLSEWDCTLEPAPSSTTETQRHREEVPSPLVGEGGAQRDSAGRVRGLPPAGGAKSHGRADARQTPHPNPLPQGERGLSGDPPLCLCASVVKNRPYALRLGFRQVKGFSEGDAEKLVRARGNAYADPLILWRRSGLAPASLEKLARADAFRSMGLERRDALWAVRGLGPAPLPLFAAMGEEDLGEEPAVALPAMPIGEQVAEDYASLRLSLKRHPMALLRDDPALARCAPACRLMDLPKDRRVEVAGLVLVRQRPGTASGVIFATLEDETGVANLIIWPKVFERFRRTVLTASLIGARGLLQREGIVIHIVAERLVDLSHLLHGLAARAEPPPQALARADEVKRPGRDERSTPAPRHLPQPHPDFPSRDFR